MVEPRHEGAEWRQLLQQLEHRVPPIAGQEITLSLAAGDNDIYHGLGRGWRGWQWSDFKASSTGASGGLVISKSTALTSGSVTSVYPTFQSVTTLALPTFSTPTDVLVSSTLVGFQSASTVCNAEARIVIGAQIGVETRSMLYGSSGGGYGNLSHTTGFSLAAGTHTVDLQAAKQTSHPDWSIVRAQLCATYVTGGGGVLVVSSDTQPDRSRILRLNASTVVSGKLWVF